MTQSWLDERLRAGMEAKTAIESMANRDKRLRI